MVADGVYECNLSLKDFKLLSFADGQNNPCTIGAIIRIYESEYRDSQTGKPCAKVDDAFLIRAASAESYPVPGEVERMTGDAAFFGFLHGWAQAKKNNEKVEAASFQKLAKSIRVRFKLLSDWDDCAREKWRAVERMTSKAENMRLVGFRKSIGVVNARDDLKARNQPHIAQAVADWFDSVQFSDEQLTLKVVERYLRVHTRVTADPAIPFILITMESIHGCRHALASISTLDQARPLRASSSCC